MQITHSTLTVTDSEFSQNRASPHVGASVYASDSRVSVARCTFSNNSSATDAGGMYVAGYGSLDVSACMFSGNGVTEYAAAVSCGQFIPSRFVDCEFRNNLSGQRGGAVYAQGPADFINCHFVENTSWSQGGGALAGGGNFVNCTFIHNLSGDAQGSAAVWVQRDSTFTNCLFNGNDSAGMGGGVRINPNVSAILVNCTVAHNLSTAGAGGIQGPAMLRNCIVWNNSPLQLSGALSVEHSCVQGGWPGASNFAVDPLFRNPVGVDGEIRTLDDNLRLQASSPCVDAGDTSALPLDLLDIDGDGDISETLPLDLDLSVRIDGSFAAPTRHDTVARMSIVDLGPYEFHP